jgi:hypothetical protein
MANQVIVVAILMIVQGVLECLMGIFLAVMALVFVPSFLEMAERQQKGAPGGPPGMPPGFAELATGIYLVMGLAGLIAGIAHLVAGIRNVSYRGRVLGMVAMFLGLISIGTCYCAPTSLGVMIYGLIVYFNQETARAFELGEQGMSREEIRRTLDRDSGRPWEGPPGGERERSGAAEPPWGGEPERPRLPPPTSPDPRIVDRDRGRESEGPPKPPDA